MGTRNHRTVTRSGSGGSASSSDEVQRPLQRRKSSVEAEAASTRQVRTKSPPGSPCEEPPVALHPPEGGAGGPLPQPEDAVSGLDDGTSGTDNSSGDEASAAELGIIEFVFPNIPPRSAANIWARFVNNARACIKHYNTKYQAEFVYKHALECGLLLLGEQDGSDYYHINFHAQDKEGHSQLFFGEIRVCVAPKEEDVTCCCPVSPSDAGGKRLETREELHDYEFPAWGTAGMDKENCYGCSLAMKHPKGTCYVAGHVADPRQYFVP